MDGREFLGGKVRVELAKGGKRKERGDDRSRNFRDDRGAYNGDYSDDLRRTL